MYVPAFSQALNERERIFPISDSIFLDTLSLSPNTISVATLDGIILSTAHYKIDYNRSLLTWVIKPTTDSVKISYRVLSIRLNQEFRNKNPDIISEKALGAENPFIYKVEEKRPEVFQFGGLNSSGSISRGIGIGNTQDLSVNSNLVLQLSGKLSDDIEITAAISDDNIPIQPEGNTQQIQDFDKVFIELKKDKNILTVGDFELRRPDSYFLNFFKKTKGGKFSTEFVTNNGANLKASVAGAVAKGKYTRNIIQGIEGNQGPYRLIGDNGEFFIIVLSGTERVFIDGIAQTRGEENDYVIDYNTAEITFTSKRLITANSRISIEFEYSDRNYARSLFFFNTEYRTTKFAFKFNAYSEQDSRNQPLQIDLTDTQKLFLQSIGNEINQAFFPNIDSIGFNENEILYKKIDTLGFADVYVYSTNPDSAKFRLGFTFLGPNKGDYRIDNSSNANGRVFRWIAPQNGISQGDHAPIVLLITPKSSRLYTIGADFSPNKNTLISTEIGLSDNDVNLFSSIGNNQNKGAAYRILAQNNAKLSENLSLITRANYEFKNVNFRTPERYRPVEFERDFSLSPGSGPQTEHLGGIALGLIIKEKSTLNYQFNTFQQPGNYKGFLNAFGAAIQLKTIKINYAGSLLTAESGIRESNFLRQKLEAAKNFGILTLGALAEQERNTNRNSGTDSLNLQSFAFDRVQLFLQNADTAKTFFRITAERRLDYQPKLNALLTATVANNAGVELAVTGSKTSSLRIGANYRSVELKNFEVNARNENNLIGRLQYDWNIGKGFLQSGSYYELGTGQEPKREFIYLEVAPGQGVFAWIDYNGNGIKELNEFEIAAFPDQARFIRIARPSNEFVRTNSVSFNQTINLNPSATWRNAEGVKKFFSRFNNQTALRINRKILANSGVSVFNPFQLQVSDTSLITLNAFLRNTLFYNRSSPVFGADLSYQSNRAKSLLSNGFDTRLRNETSLKTRWGISKEANLIFTAKSGRKEFNSELFTSRNYTINFYEFGPELGFQFNNIIRLSFNYAYIKQQNEPAFGGEKSINNRLGTELRYSQLSKGSIVAKLNYINNQYNGLANSPVAYEMLEGLQRGNNLTWGLQLQRSLRGGLQLNATYDARKSPNVPTVHTGGVQLRAVF